MIHRFGRYELNEETFELREEGTLVPMEPQVFEVLAYLVRNHDRIVSKDELLDNVWGNRFVSDAALNSRLMAARRAVQDNGRDQRLIKTVHGRGYRFIAPLSGRTASPEQPDTREQTADAAAGERIVGRPAPDEAASGREHELELLHAWFSAARSGLRQTVFVVGEAGSGKTTLIDEFVRNVEAAGPVLVASGQCLEQRGKGETFLPVFDAIERVARANPHADLASRILRHAPSWAAQMPGLFGPEEQLLAHQRSLGTTGERMLREATDLLESIAAHAPLLIVLEDVHWTDQATADLISALARRREAARLMVVASYRPDDRIGAGSQVQTLAHDLRLRSLAHIIEVPALPVDTISGMLAPKIEDEQERRAVAEALHRRTDGNGLFIRSLLDELPVDLLRSLASTAAPDLELPASLSASIELRFDRLDALDRSILDAASVCGPLFDAGSAAAALALDRDEVEERCEQLARRGRLIVAQEDASGHGFAFVHGLYQEVLYRLLLPSQKSRYHRRLGEYLEAAYATRVDEHAGELAVHFARGREPARAVHYLRLAALQSARRGGYREAVLHLTHALDLLPALEDPEERDRHEMNLRMLLASALLVTRGFRHEDVVPHLKRAQEVALGLNDERVTSEALLNLAALLEYRSEHEQARDVLQYLQSLDFEAPTVRVPMHGLLSCSYFHQGDFHQSRDQGDRGLLIADPELADPRFAVLGEDPTNGCSEWSSEALCFLGYLDQARDRIEAAIAVALRPDRQYTLASTRSHAARIYHLRREPEQVLLHAVATAELAAAQGYVYHHAVALVLAGWANVSLGRTEDGIEMIRRGIEEHEATGAEMDRPYFLGLLAEALIEAGRPREARDILDSASASIADEPRYFFSAELHRLRALILAGEGNVAAAEGELREAMAIARVQAAAGLELRAAVSLARLLQARGEPAGAASTLRPILESFTEGHQTADLIEATALLAGLTASP
ncbi:MAG: AAA family ATPase [Dehalococcoidia bacterium]